MNFFTWLMTKRKTLSTMSVTELRSQEMLLENERNRLQARLSKLAKEKAKIVERGAKEKTPELRRMLAQQYDLLHTEQMMVARQLNMRTKELLTVSRLRMLREMAASSSLPSGAIAPIREKDLATIEKLIENDSITAEIYQQRLDEILRIGAAADQETTAAISPAAEEILRVWEQMDAGLIENPDQAFDEAEKRVREREAGAE